MYGILPFGLIKLPACSVASYIQNYSLFSYIIINIVFEICVLYHYFLSNVAYFLTRFIFFAAIRLKAIVINIIINVKKNACSVIFTLSLEKCSKSIPVPNW